MVRISDTGEQELNEFRASVAPKASGYGPLDTGPATKAPPRTDTPLYSPPSAPQYTPTPAPSYSPSSWLPNSWQPPSPAVTAWEDVTSFSPPRGMYSLDFETQGYQSPIVAPFADAGAQTTQYVDPWLPRDEPQGFMGNLGAALSGPLEVLDAPREYVGAPFIGNTIQGWDRLLDGDFGGLGQINPIGAAAGAVSNNRGSYETYEGYRDQLPMPLQVGADIAADPLTWLGPGALKGALGRAGTVLDNPVGRVASNILEQPTSVGVGQVLGGTAGAGAVEAFDLEGPWATAAILGGTVLGGASATGAVRGLSTAAQNAPDAARNLAGSNPFAAPTPSAFDLPGGAIDPTTGRPFEWQSPMGGADEAIGGMRPDDLNVPRLPETAPRIDVPELAQPKVDVPFEGQRAILDALQEQIRFRESGAAEELIRQGRRAQAQGISGALAQGGTLDEVLQGTAAGARVGPMLPTGSPLNIAPEAIQSATDSIVKLGLDSPFDTMTSLRAFNKLLNGQKLQPKEIKLLGKVFGSDVEDLIRRTNANRIAIKAELTPADMAEITRRAEVDGKRVARLEVEAQAQHKLANQLRERARMAPTNKQLAKAADDAQARALKLETDAERLLIDRANRAEVKAIRKAQGTAQRSAAQASQKALRADLSAEYKSSGAQALENATRMINESDASPLLKQQVTRAMEVWMEANGKILDSLGDDAPTVLRRIYAAATGELTDSWTQKLIIETGFMRNALEESGYHPDLARSIVRQLQDAEVARRFGDNIPKHVQDSLDQLRLGQDTAAVTAQSLGGISQVLKNTTLGIGDLAVFGQQGVKLSITNVVPLLAGTINRALHLAGAGMDVGFTANNLPKRVQNALDGLQTSSRGIVDFGTAAADDLSGSKYTTLSKAAERAKGGTVVSLIPGIGKTIDRPIVAATEFLTDLQFKHVLGWARSTVYEGNLMMLKAAGEDITDPLVRQRAANWANVASGAADLATRSTRREVERAGFLSPALTRAQVQQGGQVLRGLKAWLEDPLWAPTFGKVSRNLDAAARVDRVLAASTVVGTVGSALLIGKLLNDWIGVTDFEFDPSEGGFGNITLPNGTVVNVFSQTQIPKALARSLRILVEDGVTADDVGPLLTEIGKLAVGRSSPAARLIGQAFDTGFNPDEGYQFGDLDMNWRQQLLSNLTPPIVQSVVREGVDAVRTPLEAFGFSAYEESDYTARDRAILADPRFNDENGQPRKYSELSPSEKREAISLHGATEPFGEEGRQAAEVTAEILEKQKASDQRLDSGELTPEQWKNDYNDRRHDLFVLKDFIYRDLDLKPGDDPILDGYYAAIEEAERADGTVDWDRVDSYVGGLSRKDKRYIRENTGLINLDTPQVREFEAARDRIEDAGWFERTDQSWANVVSYYPELGQYKSYYDWRDAQKKPLIEAWVKEYGFSPEYAAREADTYLDEQQPATDYDFYAKMWREAWVEANPQAAYDAWKYGYYTPTNEYAVWLNQMYQGGYVK